MLQDRGVLRWAGKPSGRIPPLDGTLRRIGRNWRPGYIKGLAEEAPAVITLNMRAASACVNEFVARAFPYRQEPNRLYARTEFSLAAAEEDYTAEDAFERADNLILGRGALEPLLGLPVLAQLRTGASE